MVEVEVELINLDLAQEVVGVNFQGVEEVVSYLAKVAVEEEAVNFQGVEEVMSYSMKMAVVEEVVKY